MKPLFIWAGGKTKMFKHYESLMPSPPIESYSEPFFGGGAMFLKVMDMYQPKRVYLNDINEGIMSIYSSIKNNVGEFCHILDSYCKPYLALKEKEDRKKFYYDVRKENAWDYEKWNETEQSAVLYFLMKTGFNGIWQINKNTNNRYGTPSGLLNQKDKVYDKENVQEWNKILNKIDVTLTSKDWKEVPLGDFTFYDPPYRNSFADYNTSFDDTETEALITRVEENKNVWLSNRDSGDGFFENRKATLKKFPVTYTAGRRKKTENGFAAKKATEILLFN
jgi:DNA adenine methylase